MIRLKNFMIWSKIETPQTYPKKQCSRHKLASARHQPPWSSLRTTSQATKIWTRKFQIFHTSPTYSQVQKGEISRASSVWWISLQGLPTITNGIQPKMRVSQNKKWLVMTLLQYNLNSRWNLCWQIVLHNLKETILALIIQMKRWETCNLSKTRAREGQNRRTFSWKPQKKMAMKKQKCS